MNYSGTPQAGILFWEGHAFTESGLHPTSSWLPCVDLSDKLSEFRIEVRVRPVETAVCSGQLVGWDYDGEQDWKSFHYKVREGMCTAFYPQTLLS